MDGLEKAKLKDRILQFLIDNPKGNWDEENFYLKLDKPVNSISHMKEIVDEMLMEAPKIVEVSRTQIGDLLSCNDFTMEFRDKGGFVAEYKKQLEAAQKLNEAAKREANIKELQEVELKQKIKYNKYALRISIISALVAMGSLLYTILQPKPESNDERLKLIEGRLDSLESSMSKKSDSIIIKKDTVK